MVSEVSVHGHLYYFWACTEADYHGRDGRWSKTTHLMELKKQGDKESEGLGTRCTYPSRAYQQ
jgi:hypothetical protein